MLTGTKKYQHINPVLASLHWLPVNFRIDFKVILFTFKSLNGLAPPYLSDLLKPYTPARALRSADKLLLVVRKTYKKTRGDRAIAAAAPRLWNSLPLNIRSAHSINIFKSLLKTHLFSLAFNRTWFYWFVLLFYHALIVLTVFIFLLLYVQHFGQSWLF